MPQELNSQFMNNEVARKEAFYPVWDFKLNHVFADVAKYYDRANVIASLGMLNWWLRKFIATIDVRPGDKVLDVCAGTNVMGIALMKKQPRIMVQAIDRSPHMQQVGAERAARRGFVIQSDIGDVHELPYPDDHFDIVTLQYASRHLGIAQVASEIKRVLKPGGAFYHCDMLRPSHPWIERQYYRFLRFTLDFTSWLFGSKEDALSCRQYFIESLEMFYSAEELADLLEEVGFTDVTYTKFFGGMVAFHKSVRPLGDV